MTGKMTAQQAMVGIGALVIVGTMGLLVLLAAFEQPRVRPDEPLMAAPLRRLADVWVPSGLYVYDGTNVCVYLSYQGRTIAAISRPAGGCF